MMRWNIEFILNKLAKKFGLDENEMKVLQAQYINIGEEWVTYAGTSTGPFVGVTMCCLTAAGVLSYKKRKDKKSMMRIAE